MSSSTTNRVQTAVIVAALVISVALLVGFNSLAPAGEADSPGARDGGAPREPDRPAPPEQADGPDRPDRPVPTLNFQPATGPSFELIQLLDDASVSLHESPGGDVIETMGPRTEFGSEIVVPVLKKKQGWLGIQTGLLPNGRLGWMRFDGSRMARLWTKYALRVDISDRSLELRYGGKPIDEFTVTVGAVGSDTPSGRFAVTDAITFSDSPWYGCCALALSAHQPQLPVGWIGGDRVAIHGTTGGVGLAESNGCIRATNDAMGKLFDRVPLGTPVFIAG